MTAYEPWTIERARALIAGHKDQDGPLLPILHALVEEFGYVDEAAEPLIAEALNISRAEVYGVVTFYHDFRRKPAGRHVLKLCRAEACQAAGGDAIAERAEQRLVEMIQKAAAIGVPTVVAVSAPTALAVRMADAAGMTLVAVARHDGFEMFTHPQRIEERAPAHVA